MPEQFDLLLRGGTVLDPASGRQGCFDVAVQGDSLVISPQNQPSARLWPSSATAFFLKVNSATVTFLRDASGAVTGCLVRDNNGEERIGRKVR